MLNNYYQNIGIKGFIKRYGVVNACKRGMYLKSPFHFVRDYEMKKILWQDKAAKKVEKYLKYANIIPEGIQYSDNVKDMPIWVYWDKGIQKAPDIIKKCYESLLKYGNGKVILLTENNINEYIQMPIYIENKLHKGQISMAAYTDLIRFSLLAYYGGTWIDATVYLTDKIPEPILESDFWVFRNTLGLLANPVLYPSWFIHAKKENEIIMQIRNVAFAYWTDNQHIIEYLLPNIILTKILNQNPNIEKTMPYLNSDYSEYLVRVLGDEYTKEKMSWIKGLTSIHKLTYKLDPEINKSGSIYRYLLEY